MADFKTLVMKYAARLGVHRKIYNASLADLFLIKSMTYRAF